jgi:hypothetical protein
MKEKIFIKRKGFLRLRNTKNRKRLANTAIAFLLVFAMGAAFALATGQLEIGGTALLASDEGWVYWSRVAYNTGTGPDVEITVADKDATAIGGLAGLFGGVIDSITVSGGNGNSTATPAIPGRSNQRISLDLAFEATGGFAEIEAYATNGSLSTDAEITGITVYFTPPGGTRTTITETSPGVYENTAWGITMTAGVSSFVGQTLDTFGTPATDTAMMSLQIIWDGSMPDLTGINPRATQYDFGGLLGPPDLYDVYEFEYEIEFTYEAA